MAWLIWTQRNRLRLNKAAVNSHQIAATAKDHIVEFAQTYTTPLFPRVTTTPPQTKWRPPHLDLVKINCDGATFKEQNKSGVGVVIRDRNRMVLASMAKQIPQLYTALEIEAMAASSALSFASQLGFTEVFWSPTLWFWSRHYSRIALIFPRMVCCWMILDFMLVFLINYFTLM